MLKQPNLTFDESICNFKRISYTFDKDRLSKIKNSNIDDKL